MGPDRAFVSCRSVPTRLPALPQGLEGLKDQRLLSFAVAGKIGTGQRRSQPCPTGCPGRSHRRECRVWSLRPYARKGVIDHQTLSFDAYDKFIEDTFLGDARLDPQNDGRPDPRPAVREKEPILGDMRRDFDFNQSPRPPLSTKPPTGPSTRQ